MNDAILTVLRWAKENGKSEFAKSVDARSIRIQICRAGVTATTPEVTKALKKMAKEGLVAPTGSSCVGSNSWILV